MYTIISLVFSLIIAFALSNLFNFFIVWVIACVCIDLFLCYMDTLISGTNKVFKWGLDFWEYVNDSDYVIVAWVFLFHVLIAIYLFLFVVGAILTAPIWHFLSNKRPKYMKVLFVAAVVLVLLGLYFYGIVLLINPLWIYRYIHFGLIIGVFIAATAISIAMTIHYKHNEQIKTAPAVILLVAEAGLLPIMIVGVVLSTYNIYSIAATEDMNVFKNAPITYDTAMVLESDLDFTDKDVSWYGACGEFKGVFDGKGHTISNINFKGGLKGMADKSDYKNAPTYGLGFVRENAGIIRNINFENCKVTITVLGNEGHTSKYSYLFALIAARNSGKTENCILKDCQAKYFIEYTEPRYSFSISKDNENEKVITENIDEEFYNEAPPLYGKTWSKIN